MPMYAYKGVATTGKYVDGIRDADRRRPCARCCAKTACWSRASSCRRAARGQSRTRGRAACRASRFRRLLRRRQEGRDRGVHAPDGDAHQSRHSAVEALGALVEQIANVRLKTPISRFARRSTRARSFADAIGKHPKLFDELYVSMVRAGELAGNLDEVLSRLADFLEASQKLKAKIMGAMIYPTVMIVVGTASCAS